MSNTGFSDEQAMNWIADILREPEWEPESLARIADIVCLTGRDIEPLESDEDE